MNFACDRCGRRYSVPDERIQGRAFRVTCKACGTAFVVRPGAPAAAPGPASVPPPPRAAPASPAPPHVRPPAPPAHTPLPAAPASEDNFGDVAAALATERRRADIATSEATERSDPFRSAMQPEPTGERGLTTSEIAWMSDPERTGRTELPAAGAPAPSPRSRNPGVLRLVLAAVLLGLVAAGAAWTFWPHSRRAPAPPPRVATAPAPKPPPAPPPVEPAPPPAPTTSAPDAAPAPAAPEPASTPSRASLARFEPGSVTVAPSRKRTSHKISQKDRKLLDLLARKDTGAAPPEPVEKLDLDSASSLEPAAVERVVNESQGAFSGCITRTSRPGQGPGSRRATLLLTVSSAGTVSAAWLAEGDVSKTLLGRCIVNAARRLVFPSFEGQPVDVSVPLLLEAR